jgi:hypothetical protein
MPVGATLLAPANGKSVRFRRGRAAVMDICGRESICFKPLSHVNGACDGKAKIRGGSKARRPACGQGAGDAMGISGPFGLVLAISGTAGKKLACAIALAVRWTVHAGRFRKQRRFCPRPCLDSCEGSSREDSRGRGFFFARDWREGKRHGICDLRSATCDLPEGELSRKE